MGHSSSVRVFDLWSCLTDGTLHAPRCENRRLFRIFAGQSQHSFVPLVPPQLQLMQKTAISPFEIHLYSRPASRVASLNLIMGHSPPAPSTGRAVFVSGCPHSLRGHFCLYSVLVQWWQHIWDAITSVFILIPFCRCPASAPLCQADAGRYRAAISPKFV